MRISVQTVPAISEYQCHSGILNLIPKAFGDWNFESAISIPIAIGDSSSLNKSRDTLSRWWPGEPQTHNIN
jgi:hypothetical protein